MDVRAKQRLSYHVVRYPLLACIQFRPHVNSAVHPNPLYLISKSHSFDKVSVKFVILTVGLILEMKSF
jgi:hypothetical protein